MNKRYTMIITSEDERYGTNLDYQLSHWTDNPWDGLLVDVVHGNTYDELMKYGDFEGLFYQLYDNTTGRRIGYGMIDASIEEEIEWNEKVYITVYRDTIEEHDENTNMSDILVSKKIAKQYYNEYFANTADNIYEDFENFLAEYTCNDTENFYKYAKKHNAIIKIKHWR